MWPYPWEGLAFDEAAWHWELVEAIENGTTKHPPMAKRGWKRWYFRYRIPSGEVVRVSADRDPESKMWFNPHRSSGEA